MGAQETLYFQGHIFNWNLFILYAECWILLQIWSRVCILQKNFNPGWSQANKRNMTNSKVIKNVQVQPYRRWNRNYTSFNFLIKGKEKTLNESMVLNNGFFHCKVSFGHWTLLLGVSLCCIKRGPDCHPNMTTFDRLELSSNTCQRRLYLSPLWPVARLGHTTGLLQYLVQRHGYVRSKGEKQKKSDKVSLIMKQTQVQSHLQTVKPLVLGNDISSRGQRLNLYVFVEKGEGLEILF